MQPDTMPTDTADILPDERIGRRYRPQYAQRVRTRGPDPARKRVRLSTYRADAQAQADLEGGAT